LVIDVARLTSRTGRTAVLPVHVEGVVAMGVFTASGETLLAATPEEVYDFVSNPHNWPKLYRGSAGVQSEIRLPVQVGDTWSETVAVGEDFSCRSTWTLITAVRPRKWVFQQVNGIGAAPDGSGGVDGITTISYTFAPAGDGTLFHRSIHCEMPHGTVIPEPLLLARANPANIEHYQLGVERAILTERASA
jgi:hypothetical protein